MEGNVANNRKCNMFFSAVKLKKLNNPVLPKNSYTNRKC